MRGVVLLCENRTPPIFRLAFEAGKAPPAVRVLEAVHGAVDQDGRNAEIPGLPNDVVDARGVALIDQAHVVDDDVVARREVGLLNHGENIVLILADQGDFDVDVL